MATDNKCGNQGEHTNGAITIDNREQTRGLRDIIADQNLTSGDAAWEVFRASTVKVFCLAQKKECLILL